MAVSPGWDRNPSNTRVAGVGVNNFNQTQDATGSQDSRGQTTERSTQTVEQRNRSVQSSFQQNLTPNALASLESLIAQLSDRPAISEAELDAKAPMPTARFDPGATGPRIDGVRSAGAWIWTDPLTGRTMSSAEARKLTAEREAQRTQLTQEAGVIPGGTEQQRADAVLRDQTSKRLADSVGDFSKTEAEADATAIVDQIIRRVQESELSALTRAAEGAGTSQSAVRALITNDLSARAGEAGAVAAGDLATKYGTTQANISNALQNILGQDPALDGLLAALGIAKGAVQSGVTVSNQDQDTTTTVEGTKSASQEQSNASQTATQRNTDVDALLEALEVVRGVGVGSPNNLVQQVKI